MVELERALNEDGDADSESDGREGDDNEGNDSEGDDSESAPE